MRKFAIVLALALLIAVGVFVALRSRYEPTQESAPEPTPVASAPSSVAGRLVAQNLNGARVKLQRLEPIEESWDLDTVSQRFRLEVCDREGRFLVEDLVPGVYELEGRTSDGSQAVVARIVLESGQLLDVGEIQLVAGASLKGRALLPDHVRAADVDLQAFAGGLVKHESIREDGSFEIRALPSGRWRLDVASRPPGIVDGFVMELDLQPGETRETDLDLRGRRAPALAVSVRANGQPVQASIRVKGVSGGASFFTKENGRGSSAVGMTGPATVLVRTARGMPLTERSANFVSDDVALDFDVEVGRLEISASLAEGSWNCIFLITRSADGSGEPAEIGLQPTLVSPGGDFGPIAVGRWDLELLFREISDKSARTVATSSTSIEVRRGEIARAIFPAPTAP